LKLLEYQGQELFARVGLPVPPGRWADSPEQAQSVAQELGFPVVVKAQVAAGGRGKAGGIRLARTPQEVHLHATSILRLSIQGEPVRRLLITQAVEIDREYYLGITLDRAARRPVLIFSTQGGVDIEEVAKTSPQSIHRCHISPLEGLHAFQIRRLLFAAQIPKDQLTALVDITQKLYQAFVIYRAQLVEINPLAVSPDGRIWALDSKFILDDDDLPPDIPNGLAEGIDPLEKAARGLRLQYVKLQGKIGIIGNGAGLVMATLDLVKLKGADPANFLDVGGGASREEMSQALQLVVRDPQVTGVFINIFGGITRCDVVAQGIIAAKQALDIRVPLVVRLVGTNEVEGRRLLQQAHGVMAVSDMEEGAAQIARLVGHEAETAAANDRLFYGTGGGSAV
jgi:succinyl-CoA synthetase beta subunit